MKNGIESIAVVFLVAACLPTSADAGNYHVLSGEGDICSDLAAWANGGPSQVRAVDWSAFDTAATPGVKTLLTQLKAQGSSTEDTFFIDRFDEGQSVVFVKSAKSDYDYRDSVLYVAAANGRRICFVNGAINGNGHCQDDLHEQLPGNCTVCDANYQWQPQWRLSSELLLWRATVYAADVIVNGPYVILWKSPARFRLVDETIPPEADALCVLER